MVSSQPLGSLQMAINGTRGMVLVSRPVSKLHLEHESRSQGSVCGGAASFASRLVLQSTDCCVEIITKAYTCIHCSCGAKHISRKKASARSWHCQHDVPVDGHLSMELRHCLLPGTKLAQVGTAPVCPQDRKRIQPPNTSEPCCGCHMISPWTCEGWILPIA